MDRLLLLESSITRLERRAERLQQVSNKYWTARRAIFISGLLLASLSCGYSGSVAGWVVGGLFVVVFCVIAIYHGRVLGGISSNSVMLNIKLIQVARIRLDWDQMPRPDQTLDESNAGTDHPFEADLDITGWRSLHRLLDSAVTREGSHRLIRKT